MANLKYLRLPQYEVGKYPKDRLEKVQDLFSQAFGGRKESLEMLHWQMENNPSLKLLKIMDLSVGKHMRLIRRVLLSLKET